MRKRRKINHTYQILLLWNGFSLGMVVVVVVSPQHTLAGWADTLIFSIELFLVHYAAIHILQPYT